MKRFFFFFGLGFFLLANYAFADTKSYTVTGTVLPKDSNFSLSVVASPLQKTYRQGDVIQYTITYGTTMGGPIQNYTIVANWNNDTPPTTVWTNVVDYVPGSATNAYNNTPGIVDLLHRQIVWTVPILQGPIENQTVSFKLVGTSNYPQTFPVNFTIYGHSITPYLTTTPVNTLQTFQYDPTYVVSNPAPTIIPTPPLPNAFTQVSIDSLTTNQATIGVATRYPTSTAIYYSSNPKSLTNVVKDATVATSHQLQLSNLTPNTTYYFQVFAADNDGKTIRSGFYTVKTTAIPVALEQTLGSLIVTANNTVLYSGTLPNSTYQPIILPTNSSYETTFTLPLQTPLQFATVVAKSEVQERTTPLFQGQNNQFSATLTTDTLQTQSLYARVGDKNGNIIEQFLAKIKVVDPLTVVDKQTNNPIEHASVQLYTEQNNTYMPLRLTNLQNPTYTDTSGIAHIILPNGTYKAVVSAQGYDSKEVVFSLAHDGYPKIALKKQPYSLTSWLWYIFDTLKDFLQSLWQYVASASLSHRVFDLFSAVTLSGFVLLSFGLFYLKTHLHLKSLPLFFAYHLFIKRPKHLMYGKVVNKKGVPISRVGVYLLNKDGLVLESAFTNKNGSFVMSRPKTLAALTCIKEGYLPETMALTDEKPLLITLGYQAKVTNLVIKTATTIEFIAGFFFEIVLLLSLLLEILFIQSFGFSKVAPFLFLSLVNVVLGLLYLKDRAKH